MAQAFARWSMLFVLGTACGQPGLAARQVTEAPRSELPGAELAASFEQAYIVDWPAADRGAFEARALRTIQLARFVDRKLELVSGCKVTGAYAYRAVTPKHERLTIKSEDDARANFGSGGPIDFSAKLRKHGELNLRMTLLGRYEANRDVVLRSDLEGTECTRATHVISALSVGAFEFIAGAAGHVSASVGAVGVGVKGESNYSREALSSDGNEAACERAGASDSAPPKDCAAPIRIELQPLGKPAAAAPELKPAELGAKRLGLYRQDSWYLDSPPKLDRGFILKLLTKEQKSLAERVFHAEDAMKTAEQKRRELPGKLDSCIKSSCPKRAELEAQSGPLEQRYWSAVAAYHDMARAVSEPLLKAVAAAPSAAAHLMASENEDIAQMAVALEAHASTASPDAEAHRLEAARQLMQARDSAAGDEELLRVVLWRLGAVSSGAEAVTAFERLSRLGSLRSDERGRVHIKLGSALEAVGRLDEADATLAWEDAKPGHWTHAVKVFVRTRIALKQNQCQRVLALTAEGIDAFLRAPQRGFASQVHTESAADCVERLGGLDRAPFRGSPLAFAYLAMTVAERAVEREDLDEAIRAWRLVVERARSTIIAAEALAALVGAYDALGNPARAEELWGERKSFTVASLDAESNAGRTFTREDIERALTIPGFRTSSNSDDLGERVEPALRSVLEPCFVGHTLPKPAKVSVAVRVRSSRGELQASASDGSALPEEALACTRRLGAARFAVWDRPFKVEVELSTDGVARGWL